MKYSIVILTFIIFYHFNVYCQKDTIKYIIPDSVELAASAYIEMQKSSKATYRCYFNLQKESKGIYTLFIHDYSDRTSSKLRKWINSTSRFLLIDTSFYPVLSENDFAFGTVTKNDFGSIGSRIRNLKIRRIFPIGEPFFIRFSKKGEVIQSGYQ